ncbi:MAG TPA: septum formation initiator family protein [Desulfuromonadales bacterium]|nr:septum formation initiator family protein [Desulfuromonadales bacterium]
METPFSDRFTRKYLVVTGLCVALLLGLALFGDKGVLRVIQDQRQKEALTHELSRLKETNAALLKQISALRSDPHYIEGIARRELGMVRKDELVYQFPSHAPQPSSSAAPAHQQH